jgi:hypothetical protein
MAFPDDLLEQAYDLANKEPINPKQASLRRAVSTAYYALFHLLIDEAVSKWAVERQRSILARTFEHGKMKGICHDVLIGCQDRLRMKLHGLNRQLAVAHAHDDAVLRLGGHFQARRESLRARANSE